MLPLVVQNVQCACVLSDILRRCSMTAPGVTQASDVKAEIIIMQKIGKSNRRFEQ